MELNKIILVQTAAGAGASILSLIAFAVLVYRKSSPVVNIVTFVSCQALTILLVEIGTTAGKRLTIQHILIFSIVFLTCYGAVLFVLRFFNQHKGSATSAPLIESRTLSLSQKESGSFSDIANMGTHDSRKRVNPLEVSTDFERAAQFFPILRTKLNDLSPFGTETQERFIKEILQTKKFQDPDSIVGEIIDDYASRRFGHDKLLQQFGCSLISKKNYKAADELENYIRVVGDSVANNEIIQHVEKNFGYGSFPKRIERLYSVKNGEKNYFVAVLKDGSCIGEINGRYQKVRDIVWFRESVQDRAAEYSVEYSNDVLLKFLSMVPVDMLELNNNN